MTLPPVYRLGAIAIGSCIVAAGFLLASSSSADADPVVTAETVEIFWLMPDGGTASYVTWPQTYLPDGEASIPCGTTAQADRYVPTEVASYTDDGILTEGEDYPSDIQAGAVSWRFVYGGDCPDLDPETPAEEIPTDTIDAQPASDVAGPDVAAAAPAPVERTLPVTGGDLWLLVPFALLTTVGATLLAIARRNAPRKASCTRS